MPDHLGDDMRKIKNDDKEEPDIKGKMFCLVFAIPLMMTFNFCLL